MRKKILLKRQARLEAKKAELIKRSKESENVEELRSINEKLQDVAEQLQDISEELLALAEDEGSEGGEETPARAEDPDEEEEEGRSAMPANAQFRNGRVVGAFGMGNGSAQRRTAEDPADTEEYRTAFMNYVCRGVEIPAQLRAATTTADAGAVIPTTIMNEIIQTLDTYGNVYAAVRKLNVQGGIAIPILSLKPEATWIGETSPSADKKLQANESITFSYFGVECKISQTLLANVTTLDAFQKLFVPLATEAIVKAVEIAIFHGNGTTQPLGILNDTRVPEDNVITLTPAEFASWSAWHKKVKAKMKKAYRNGAFFMNQATFDGYIDGMVDEQGQPIGRTNYGINGEETYRFMGKAVETVEDGCLSYYDDAADDEVVAVFMKPTDFALNSNLQMTTVKWVDHDTNEVKNKCILVCDGKLVDVNGVLIIKKGAAEAQG